MQCYHNGGQRLRLHGAIYHLDSFVSMLHYCANLKVITITQRFG